LLVITVAVNFEVNLFQWCWLDLEASAEPVVVPVAAHCSRAQQGGLSSGVVVEDAGGCLLQVTA
jgi:hypothetical protein